MGARLAHHDAGRPPRWRRRALGVWRLAGVSAPRLVPARDARRARAAAPPGRGDDRGRWTRSRRGPAGDATRGATRCATPSTGPTRPSASCCSALRAAFVTPLEPEDLFALSRGIDRILNYAQATSSASRRSWPARPTPAIAEMAALLGESVRAHRRRDRAARLGRGRARPRPPTRRSRPSDGSSAPTARAWPALLEVDDLRERIARRELYRRCSRIGETVVDVAERVVYAVVKES